MTQTVTSGSSGVYTASWNASGASNGTYTFAATAETSSNIPGNTWQENAVLELNGAPAQVTGLAASAGNGRATLSWTACTASDFAYYQLWRGTSSGAETLDINNLTANGVTDTGLTNGTKYYYVVYAVDTNGNISPASSEVSVTPATQSDTTTPTAPGSFTVTRSGGNAVLSWTASTAGSSGIACYYIYRDGGALPFARVPGATLTYSDIVGYTVAHSYTVVACSGAGLLSSPSASANISHRHAPHLHPDGDQQQGDAGGQHRRRADRRPADARSTTDRSPRRSGTPAVWSSLPYGWYKVTATCGSAGPVSQTVFLNAATTVPFTF